MIYLIATSMLFIEDMHSETILKIGYTDDSRGNGRFQDYICNGLVVKILSTIPGGSLKLEGLVQDYFSEYSIPSRSKEWFFYRNEIIDFFMKDWDDKSLLQFLLRNSKTAAPKYILPSLSVQLDILVKTYESRVDDNKSDKVCEHLRELRAMTNFQDRMKYICTTANDTLPKDLFNEFLNYIPELYKTYYETIGPERCKALEYRSLDLYREIDKLKRNSRAEIEFTAAVYCMFEVGGRYKASDIKNMFRKLIEKFDMVLPPKAVLIKDYFIVKKVLINDPVTKKRDHGFEILARKEK